MSFVKSEMQAACPQTPAKVEIHQQHRPHDTDPEELELWNSYCQQLRELRARKAEGLRLIKHEPLDGAASTPMQLNASSSGRWELTPRIAAHPATPHPPESNEKTRALLMVI